MKKIKKLVTWVVALAMCFSLTSVSGLTSVTAFAADTVQTEEHYYRTYNSYDADNDGSHYFTTLEDAISYLENGFEDKTTGGTRTGGTIYLLKDIEGPITLSTTVDQGMFFDLSGHSITSSSEDATITVSGGDWAFSCICDNGGGIVVNNGSGPAISVTTGTIILSHGIYESSCTNGTVVCSGGSVLINGGTSSCPNPTTVINNAENGVCLSGSVSPSGGVYIPGDDVSSYSGAYHVTDAKDGEDGYVFGTVEVTLDENDNAVVTLSASGSGATFDLTEDADYTVDYSYDEDAGVLTVTVTPLPSGDPQEFQFEVDSYDDSGSDGYYVSEAGGYVPGTLDVTLDENNEAVVTVTAEDGTVYTLVEGTDYTVSYDTTGDGIYVVTVTLLDENGEAYGEEYTFEFDLGGSSNEGYYVSEVGDYVPGTLNVTLDENNEAVVTVTAADGTVYTLVEGTDYVVSYEEVDGTYVVTVTLLDENGETYAEYEFGFGLYYVSEVDGWIPGTLGVTLDENNEAVVTVTASDGTVYTLVEGVDYTVTYTETDEGLFVTVTLLDENGEGYASYDFFFELGAEADGTGIVKTGDSGRIWMYTILAMAAAAAVALVLAGNKKYARK